MDPRLKQAAKRLLDIASKMEKKALEETFFVCESCNHTASLVSINRARKEAADKHGIENIAEITANDSIACKACDGTMLYVPTEESRKYYIEAAEGDDALPPLEEPREEEAPREMPEEEESGEEKPKKPKKEKSEIFDPVDEQEEGEEELPPAELGKAEVSEREEPEEEPEEEAGVIEEEVAEAEAEEPEKKEKPKPKKKTKDKPDDGKVKFPKDETPKFEKMPKDASEEFRAAVSKYWPE